MGSATPIYIRTATLSDAPAIAGLSSELGYDTGQDKVGDRINQLLNSSEDGIFVAYNRKDEVVGWVHVYASYRLMIDAFADLGGLVVSESHQGFGVGSQLLKKAEAWAQTNGYNKLRIRSNVLRERAHKFYISKDYKTVKSQKVFEKSLH
jgi:GNAT superfamily N-acetyltransferase